MKLITNTNGQNHFNFIGEKNFPVKNNRLKPVGKRYFKPSKQHKNC